MSHKILDRKFMILLLPMTDIGPTRPLMLLKPFRIANVVKVIFSFIQHLAEER